MLKLAGEHISEMLDFLHFENRHHPTKPTNQPTNQTQGAESFFRN
jgi:hypothetical protein